MERCRLIFQGINWGKLENTEIVDIEIQDKVWVKWKKSWREGKANKIIEITDFWYQQTVDIKAFFGIRTQFKE